MTDQQPKATEYVIVLGNHVSHVGIGDVAYTVHDFFSRIGSVVAQSPLVPGKVNIIIDEFTNPHFVAHLSETKKRYPATKYIIVATEFYTPMRIPGLGVDGTFNFFGSPADWRSLSGMVARRLKLVRTPESYMHRRFLGFLKAMEIADVVLSVHPEILASLERLSATTRAPLRPAANLYPTVDLQKRDRLTRLRSLPFGFEMTGSLTNYRAEMTARLRQVYTAAGYNAAVYKEIPFGPPQKLDLDAYPSEMPEYLFNFNPPQQERWRFSSPMRILRSALLGQIPVVTKKFGDHEIERMALLWDASIDMAQRFWCDATLGRETLVETFIDLVSAYNRSAGEKNKALNAALAQASVG